MDSPQDNKLFSRRDALKAILATGGATTLATLPDQWETPILEVGSLPAFAQTSPAQYPFTNEIEAFEIEGTDASNIQYAIQDGWIVVAENGTSVSSTTDYGYDWIFDRPWLKIKRKYKVIKSPWGVIGIKIKITYKFFSLPGYGSSAKLKDDTDIWAFVISGADLGAFSYYVSKVKIKKNKVKIEIVLPLFSTGLWPFYISTTFPSTIPLAGGGSLFPGYYVGPGCYGDSVKTSYLRKRR